MEDARELLLLDLADRPAEVTPLTVVWLRPTFNSARSGHAGGPTSPSRRASLVLATTRVLLSVPARRCGSLADSRDSRARRRRHGAGASACAFATAGDRSRAPGRRPAEPWKQDRSQ